MLENKQNLVYDEPSKTFVGVRFILQGFDPVKEDKVRSKLLEGGGIDAINYSPDCNCVIVDKLVYDDPTCVAARRDGKTLVTGLWVDHSFDVGLPVDPDSVMYWPMRDLNGIPGAQSLVVCLTGYQRHYRDDIMTMVALMGANFSKPLVASKVTHLICYKFEDTEASLKVLKVRLQREKYELAKKIKKIKLVNHHWLEDCLKAWELLPEVDYAKSGYELEMDIEAKDSEDETENIALIDLKKKSVVSPQNTRVENKNFQQLPLKQEVSRNSSYLNASGSFANVGDTSRISSTPRKEIYCGKTSFPGGIHDRHLENSSSSGKSPGKTSSGAPSNMLDGMMITEKVKHVTGSASESAKKSPDVDLSKLSRKLSLPLRSERTENNSGSSSALNASKTGFSDGQNIAVDKHQDGTDSHGVKTPLKGTLLHLDEGLTSSLHSKGRTAVPCRRSRSPMLSCSPKKSLGFGSTAKTIEVLVSGSSVDGSRSPANVISHLREEVSHSVGMPMERHLDGIELDRVQEPLKRTLLHLVEGQTSNLPSKRKMPISRGSSRSPMSCHHPKTSGGSGLTTKIMEVSVSVSSIDGSHRLCGDTSPINVTNCLREETSLAPKEAPNIYTTSENRQECSDQALQHSQEGLKKRTPTNFSVDDRSSGVEKMYDQIDLNISKAECSGAQLTLKKKKMLSRKTLGTKPTIGEGRTTKQKGLISNLQNAVVQNECINHSNGAVAMEDTDNATISEKVAMVSPTDTEEGVVGDETKLSEDRGLNEFDTESNKEDSAKVGSPPSGRSVTCTKKQNDIKPVQKKKRLESVGVKNKSEVEKSVSRCRTEVAESKSTGDAGERTVTKGKKRPLVKAKTNKLTESKEEVKNDETKSTQDEEKTISDNEETVLADRTNRRPSKKLKNTADEVKENKHATVRQQYVSSDSRTAGKEISQTLKRPLTDGSKGDKTNCANIEVKNEPSWFILSGHRLQRKEFQQVIKRLNGRVCRDSHNWSYQATHFIVPDPVKRTEKFFAAAASGCWILKTDYLTASNEAGRFLSEEPYEWNKKCLTEDGAINLEAPRKWRLLRERTGHGAFYGMRIVIYGECIAPPLDTLKRVVKAGDGTILATSPPYTRFLKSGIDFAIVSQGMPHVDIWVQEFLRHEVPCIVADYLVEYVCKPSYPLERHILYNTHAWAQKSLENLVNRVQEVVDDPTTPEDGGADDVACKVCGSHD